MAEVRISQVVKTYPNGVAGVRGVDLDIADGEFVVIVGPSGCGKLTLLRAVAGLEDVTSGTIHIGGRDVTRIEPADRNIAMVFQNYALYPHMNVHDNLAYGLRKRKTPPAEIERRVREIASILELEALLDRKPRQLSGGQRQRTAMGRAIVRNPAAFLFDEPLSNLDAKLRVQMRGEIKRLQRRLSATSLYVTHDQSEAMTMADRLVVMNEGKAEQIGPPMELYRNPATLFVAGFIGSPAMNMVSSPVESGRRGIRLGQARLQLTVATAGPVIIGIRPEHLDMRGPLEIGDATVELIEPLGSETLVHGRLGETLFVVSLDGAYAGAIGDRLPLAADPAHLLFFDGATGRRIAANPV